MSLRISVRNVFLGQEWVADRNVPAINDGVISLGITDSLQPSVPLLQFLGSRAASLALLAGEALDQLTATIAESNDSPEGDSTGPHLVDDGPHDPLGGEGDPKVHLQDRAVLLRFSLIAKDHPEGIEVLLRTSGCKEGVPCELTEEFIGYVGNEMCSKADSCLPLV